MPSNSSAGAKICVKCGKDVAGQKRMKDSQGQYWCLDCGRADQQRKIAGIPWGICSGCGESFPARALTVWGKRRYCTHCAQKIKGTKIEPPSNLAPVMLLLVVVIVIVAVMAYLIIFR